MWKALSPTVCLLLLILGFAAVALAESAPQVVAFPGAEGGGRFTTGGRGGDVYEVTTLDDYADGATPIKSSLRDAVSGSNRIIVFRVSGIIHLKSPLTIKGSNLTIAGQTAPGDGICIADHSTTVDGDNIIIRYMRFRPGDANIAAEPDGIAGRYHRDLILDHISVSWGTDECLSFYGNTNFTLQWSIIGESLTMSGHFKGKHGYGGIWGGVNSTFHHNLLAHHTSRNPRLEVGGSETAATIDLRNNVIYDWQFNSAYGGGNSSVNMVNSYYKPGPSTRIGVMSRIVNPGDAASPSTWFVSGNYVEGAPAVTANNRLGIDNAVNARIVDSPIAIEGVDAPGALSTQSAVDAYRAVLARAGATYPKRDAVDARIVNDVQNGTGRCINRDYEVGGYPVYDSGIAPVDTDHDGMPDAWEDAHGLNRNDPADGREIIRSGPNAGYSNVEVYINSLVDMNHEAQNPSVVLTSPTLNALFETNGSVEIAADAAASSGASIAKVEFYANDKKLGETTTKPYSYTWSDITEGTYYISAKAIDSNGLATQSSPVPVHVNGPQVSAPWTSKDIGTVGIQGSASMDEAGVMTVKGAGTLKGSSDAFQFVYQKMDGDGELSARIDSIANIEQDAAFSGIMIRQDLTTDSPHALLAAVHIKADKLATNEAIEFMVRATQGSGTTMPSPPSSPVTAPAYRLGNGLFNISMPYWVKLRRVGNEVTALTSPDGVTWTILGTYLFADLKESVYIGFAVDAGKTDNSIQNYNEAKFSNISYRPYLAAAQPAASAPGRSVAASTSGESATTLALGESTASSTASQSAAALAPGGSTVALTLDQPATVSAAEQSRADSTDQGPTLNLVMIEVPTGTVLLPTVEVSGWSTQDGYMTIRLNGDTVVDAIRTSAGETFRQQLVLDCGRNTYEVILTDATGKSVSRSEDLVYLPHYDMLVDQSFDGADGAIVNGVKTYKTVTAAVGAVPASNSKPMVIFIKSGTYKEKLTIDRPCVSLIGEDAMNTKITYDVAAGSDNGKGGTYGTSGSASVTITADNFTAENITFENAFDEAASTISGKQAVAVRIKADMVAFINCRFIGNQDTLYADSGSSGGRQYFSKCYIEGDVDFIFGSAQAIFEDCDIVSYDRGAGDDRNNGYIAAPSTKNEKEFGYIFRDCRLLKSSPTMGNNSVSLGRPWHPSGDVTVNSSAIYLNCYMDSHINTKGWENMSGFLASNSRFYEYGSYGPGARVSATRRVLSESEAQRYSTLELFDGWNPYSILDNIYDSVRITLDRPSNDVVHKMDYTVSGRVDSDATLTVKLGDETVVDGVAHTANTEFSANLVLADGLNRIEVTAEKDNGDVGRQVIWVNFINYAPGIIWTETPASEVRVPESTISGHLTKDGMVTIEVNGRTVLDSAPKKANEEFAQTLALAEGDNAIKVTVTDSDGNMRVAKFSTTYTIDWGNAAFSVNQVVLRDRSGKVITELEPGGGVDVYAEVVNNTGITRKAVLVVAQLDSANKPVSYAYTDIAVKAGETDHLNVGFNIPEDARMSKVKVYVVDGMPGGMRLSNEVVVQ